MNERTDRIRSTGSSAVQEVGGSGNGEEEGMVPDEFADDIEKLRVMSGVRQFPMRVKCATLAWHAVHAAVTGGNNASTE